MFEVIEAMKTTLLNLKNSEEVTRLVSDDSHAFIMRQFEKQYVILKIFSYENQVVHACIYVDYSTMDSYVSYPASFKNTDINDLVSISSDKGITKVKYSSMDNDVCHQLDKVYPEGENYVMKTSSGAEGRGGSWPLEYLGL